MNIKQIVDVLTEHQDVSTDVVAHGWQCSCGWGEGGDLRWSEWEFMVHVARAIEAIEASE